MTGSALNTLLAPPLSRWLIALLLVVLVLFPFAAGEGGRYYTVLLMTVFIFATLGHAWNLLAGFSGLLSFGAQVYVGLGGFTTAIVTYYLHGSVWLGMLLAAVVTAAFAWLLAAPLSDRNATRNTWIGVAAAVIVWIGVEVGIAWYPEAGVIGTPYIRRVIALFLIFLGALPLLRLQGAYFAVATWLLAAAMSAIFNEWRLVGAGGGMNIANDTTVVQRYFAGLVLVVASTAVVWRLLNSRYGHALTAVRDDEEAATAVGIDIRRVKTLVFVVSAPMVGLAAALYYIDAVTITPPDAFDIRWSAYVVFIVVAGGMGSLAGPILGAVAFIIVERFLVGLWGGGDLTLGIAAVLLILVLPRGMAGLIDDLRARASGGARSGEAGPPFDLLVWLGIRPAGSARTSSGRVTGAFLLPPGPAPREEAASPEARALGMEYDAAADRLAAGDPDVVVIYSATGEAETSTFAPKRLSGRYPDSDGEDSIAFDFAVDDVLARRLVRKGVPLGVGARARAFRDAPAILATHRLNPDKRLRFVVIGGAALGAEAAREVGARVAREALTLGRRVALVAVGGLSRSARPDRCAPPGALRDPADDLWNRKILGLIEAGDAAALAAALPRFAREARVTGGASHIAFLIGALGPDWAGAEIRCYSALEGAGAAVIEFDIDGK